ncbi:MAG: pyruvate kinase [Nitrospirae bacterium YQR-1]
MEIHATIGPKSKNEGTLRELIKAGVTAFRLNMSYVAPGEMAGLIDVIRNISSTVRIGADIKGRKLRIGPIEKPIHLTADSLLTLIPSETEFTGGATGVCINYPQIAALPAPGTKILLDDGAITLTVTDLTKEAITCRVIKGGQLTSRAGLNLPGIALNLPPLTDKDTEDLSEVSSAGIDFLYFSYVETKEDITALREASKAAGFNVPIVSKVESMYAVKNVTEICGHSDAICIARGDLGVEVPHASLPYVVRDITAAAKAAGKPVLLAGEVMFSLISREVPFRAELTDVVVAIESGIDGFILSDETAVGINPAIAVNYIMSIAKEVYNRVQRK